MPLGTVGVTGVAGLTLGGSIDWLLGRLGLACDSLIGADVLLADGSLVRAEDPGHVDLLWALRGGGGNFGVVLNFRYQSHALPKVSCGSIKVNLEHAEAALLNLINWVVQAPRDLTIAQTLYTGKSGSAILSIDYCYCEPDFHVINQLRQAINCTIEE